MTTACPTRQQAALDRAYRAARRRLNHPVAVEYVARQWSAAGHTPAEVQSAITYLNTKKEQ